MNTKAFINLLIVSAMSIPMLLSCDALESKEDLYLTGDMLKTRYYHYMNMGYRVYTNVPYGFSEMDGNLFATVSDEAQYVTSISESARFNNGSWNQFYNPDNRYASYYVGIHDANNFLESTVNYPELLAFRRDTISSNGKYNYNLDLVDMDRLRHEAVVMRSYYYFELLKRYGGVPMIMSTDDDPFTARASVDELVERIVKDIDDSIDGLVETWSAAGQSDRDGRVNQGMALALKSRILLYAASPLFNTGNDKSKWEKAAAAAWDLISTGRYALADSYENLFLGTEASTSVESIWCVRSGEDNEFERNNYPIGTQGGQTGVCPSYNLVAAYEHKGIVDPNNYFKGLDPRFSASILKNGDSWNGRTLQIYAGGTDDPANPNTSVTGFYLKKFLAPDLNLTNDAKTIRNWIVFRYAEILLNYAEAMNEAYGPDAAGSYGMTARQAVNMVRERSSMFDVEAANQEQMRDAIKHERRIELAFENHRYWDLKRWMDADELNKTVQGVEYTDKNNAFIVKDVAARKFDAPKMFLYPIPEEEIKKAEGKLVQNEGWN